MLVIDWYSKSSRAGPNTNNWISGKHKSRCAEEVILTELTNSTKRSVRAQSKSSSCSTTENDSITATDSPFKCALQCLMSTLEKTFSVK